MKQETPLQKEISVIGQVIINSSEELKESKFEYEYRISSYLTECGWTRSSHSRWKNEGWIGEYEMEDAFWAQRSEDTISEY